MRWYLPLEQPAVVAAPASAGALDAGVEAPHS